MIHSEPMDSVLVERTALLIAAGLLWGQDGRYSNPAARNLALYFAEQAGATDFLETIQRRTNRDLG